MKIPNEVRIGILGVAAFVIFIMGYRYLKGKGMWSSKRTVTAVYDEVGGLKPANRIALNGFDVGSVSNMYVTDGDINKGITVEMAIDKNINIPVNSKAFIVSDGVLGTKAIRIDLGDAKEYLDGSGSIQGSLENGLMDKVGDEIDPLIEKVKGTLASLDTAVNGIKNILSPSTQRNLKRSISSLDNTMIELSDFANTLGKQKGSITNAVKSLNGASANLSGFTNNLNKNNGTINRTLSNLETTSQNFSKIQLEQTVNKLNTTLGSLQSTLNKVNSGKGSMALLMNDDKLYKNLKNTSETMNNLLYDLSARPHRYINLNLFGGKKKTSPPLTAPNAE